MDSLLFTFNKEQIKLYNELLKNDNIELNFDTSLPNIEGYQSEVLNEALARIEKETKKLLEFNKNSSSFSAFLTQDEIKDLIPVYYKAIREIRGHRIKIGAESWKLSMKIGEINKILADINKRYADFLPYKAALYNRDEYALEIETIDRQFKESIVLANEYKKEILELMGRIELICNVTSEFIQKTSKASDEPKFKKFDAYDFFWATEAYLEQLKSI